MINQLQPVFQRQIRRLFKGLGDTVVPPVCRLCGMGGFQRDCLSDLCPGCMADLPLIEHHCQTCGLVLPRTVARCGQCIRQPPHFNRVWAALVYQPPIEGLVQAYKFRRELAAGRVLAGIMARQLAAQGAPRPDLLVPVPLHPRRHLWRGFNQAERLALDLVDLLGPINFDRLLVRRRATQAQSELPASRRRGNVRHAFAVKDRSYPLPPFIALVDDVMTTGATVNECARLLKRQGARRVDVWVAARA